MYKYIGTQYFVGHGGSIFGSDQVMDDAIGLLNKKKGREIINPSRHPRAWAALDQPSQAFQAALGSQTPAERAAVCRGSDPAPLATPFFIRASSSVLLPTILLFILAKAKQSGQPVQPWHMQPPSFHLIHHLLAFPLVLRPSDFLVAIPTRSDAFSAQPNPRYARCEPAAGA
jgi:hypothetical protein